MHASLRASRPHRAPPFIIRFWATTRNSRHGLLLAPRACTATPPVRSTHGTAREEEGSRRSSSSSASRPRTTALPRTTAVPAKNPPARWTRPLRPTQPPRTPRTRATAATSKVRPRRLSAHRVARRCDRLCVCVCVCVCVAPKVTLSRTPSFLLPALNGFGVAIIVSAVDSTRPSEPLQRSLPPPAPLLCPPFRARCPPPTRSPESKRNSRPKPHLPFRKRASDPRLAVSGLRPSGSAGADRSRRSGPVRPPPLRQLRRRRPACAPLSLPSPARRCTRRRSALPAHNLTTASPHP